MTIRAQIPLPFVYIEPYMHETDKAFGFWRSDLERYVLGDGDLWKPDSLRDTWPHARFLTWEDAEQGASLLITIRDEHRATP